jgi:hypothetical protein
MSRQTDALSATIEPVPVELPAIQWSSIGRSAPTVVTQPARAATEPLPKADIMVIT